jgi:putative ABC transport system permease protein
MSRFFYARLAAVNLRKNGSIYLPYLLSCIFCACMFYIMLFITLNTGLYKMPGSDSLSFIMRLGSTVIGIFSAIILLYTNSFLMKRRKKEIGLYNILGMGKGHITRVMALETVYTALITFAAGLLSGILLSKLMLMLLLKLLRFPVPFGFEVSPAALAVTVIVFAGIFFITLLINLGRVRLSKPVELLYGGSVGEKEPKTKRLLTVIGTIALGAAYVIANVTENPIQALFLFFIAVLLVILGTYCLFTAGSIALLKALRKNKRYYYQTRHFTAVSGMIYRMKQNAVGLGNICILSTMVLIMLSTTVSLYLGMEDALRNRFPKNIAVTASRVTAADGALIEEAVNRTVADGSYTVSAASSYRYTVHTLSRNGARFDFVGEFVRAATGDATVFFIPLEDYNKLMRVSETLDDGEMMVYSPNASFSGDTVRFGGQAYSVKKVLDVLDMNDQFTFLVNDTFCFVVPDDAAVEEIYNVLTGGGREWRGLNYYYGFDLTAGGDAQLALTAALRTAFEDFRGAGGTDLSVYVTSAEMNKYMFLDTYGGLFFLGIFLGALFVMATVIIMYYRQISEGYDDQKRFDIMQKVGLSREEIRKTIASQVLTVFFLPLVTAGIHIVAAFRMITKLLFILNLTNVRLFALCTLGTFAVFAVIYAAVYVLTARAYYRIVSTKNTI